MADSTAWLKFFSARLNSRMIASVLIYESVNPCQHMWFQSRQMVNRSTARGAASYKSARPGFGARVHERNDIVHAPKPIGNANNHRGRQLVGLCGFARNCRTR